MSKLRYAMIGGGPGAFIGAVHRMAASLDGQFQLVAGAFSRDPAKSRSMADELGLEPERCYDTWSTCIAQEAARPEGERIAVVVIVTPNDSHIAIALAAIHAGLHVIVDKPLGVSSAESEILQRAVSESGLVCAVTYTYSGNAMVAHARQLCRRGELGQIRKVSVQYLQEWLSVPQEKQGMKQAVWRTDPASAGPGGTLGDIGTHAFHLLEHVTGERVTELCCDLSTFLPDRELDEDANILVRLGGGGKGVISVSQIAVGEENLLRLQVYGSEASLCWEQESPDYLFLGRFGQAKQRLSRNSAAVSRSGSGYARVPAGHPEGYIEAFANIYRGVAEAIRAHASGSPLAEDQWRYPGVSEGVRGMRFIEACVASSASGGTWTSL